MKIIDLLNKIANGEEPKKIKYDGMIWQLEEDKLYYSGNVWLEDYCNITRCLNDEVEIIEEDKKIMPLIYAGEDEEINVITNKINEIIDRINHDR